MQGLVQEEKEDSECSGSDHYTSRPCCTPSGSLGSEAECRSVIGPIAVQVLALALVLVCEMILPNMKTASAVLFLLVLVGVLYGYVAQSNRFLCTEKPTPAGRSSDVFTKRNEIPLRTHEHLRYKQPSLVSGRTDVVTVTPWLAPVVWEGTFEPELLNSIYKHKNISIAATVFAVGKYIRFLKDFLETAELHFFVGFKVHIYVFTDRPTEMPKVQMAAGRQLTVRSVPGAKRWQEISARRMELIQVLIEETLFNGTDFIFCLDVDSKFHGHWGVETLGSLVAVIHPGYYKTERGRLPYERRPASRAYVAHGMGDFYYCGGAFGGDLHEVHLLTKKCRENFEADAKEGIEAEWQEESHLNRYMWTNKPSKVLSPEFLWQDFKPREKEIYIVRFSGVIKNYAEIRPN